MRSMAIAAALILLTAGAAQAFTYEGTGHSLNADGTPRFTDPEDALTDGDKAPAKSKSGFSMHFSGGTTTPGFGPFGVQNRFLPSANRAFNTPFQNQSNSPFGQN
jgi:hypothetical protein